MAHDVYKIITVVASEGWSRVNCVVILLYCIVSTFTTWGPKGAQNFIWHATNQSGKCTDTIGTQYISFNQNSSH